MKVVVVGAAEYAGRNALRALPAAVGVEASGEIEAAVEGAQAVLLCAPTWDIANRLRAGRDPHPLIPRVLGACRRAGVRRLVHLSSALVYGPDHQGPLPIDEGTVPRPAHPFERLKLQEEAWLRKNAGEVEVIVVRAATGFGAGDRVLARMLSELERGGLRLVNGGREPRTFLAGADLGRALAAAVTRGRPGATYLVGGFDATWREMFETAAHILRVPPRIGSLPYDFAYVAAAIRELRTPVGSDCWPNLLTVDLQGKAHLYDGGRTRRELVWSPQIGSFDEGLLELCAWYRSDVRLPAGTARGAH